MHSTEYIPSPRVIYDHNVLLYKLHASVSLTVPGKLSPPELVSLNFKELVCLSDSVLKLDYRHAKPASFKHVSVPNYSAVEARHYRNSTNPGENNVHPGQYINGDFFSCTYRKCL